MWRTGCAAKSRLTADQAVQTADEPSRSSPVVADEFVIRQAKGIGFTTEQLAQAIAEWTKSVQDPYEKGVAAFYEHRYSDASRYISASIPHMDHADTEIMLVEGFRE